MRKIAIFMFMLLLSTVYAEDYVAINSYDGRDVLSGVFYANAKDLPVKFLTPNSDASLFAAKVGSNHDVLLIQSDVPVSTFIESDIKARNNSVEVYSTTDAMATNLDLAKRSGAKSFIIVDSAFSDSAISVMPYAALTDSYVLLANNGNAQEVAEAVEGANKVMIYGLVDSGVTAALSSFNPQQIGTGEDKFEDNVEIVNMMMSDYNKDTVIFSDATFLEESIATSENPVVLIGKLVPDVTYDFVKQKVRSGDLKASLLLGNSLVTPVYDMRERMEDEFESEGLNKSFGIMVKFAQVIPSEETGVLVLDTFPLPSYKPAMEVGDVFYSTNDQQVMVSVDNIGEGPAYYTLEVRVQVDGADFKVFGPSETELIERGAQASEAYDFDMSSVSSGNVSAVVIVKFGSSKNSLEEFVTSTGLLESIEYVDESEVLVQSAKYNDGLLQVTIKNSGEVPAYEFAKVSLVMDGEPVSVTAGDTKSIEPGSLMTEQFPLELSEEDLSANQNVTVTVNYGARQGFLNKQAAFVVDLKKGGDEFPWIYAIAALVVLAIGVYFVTSKKGGEKPKTGKPRK